MLGNATVTAFVATANPVRAKAFYRDTLGLRLVSDDQFAIAFDCNGVQLRIQKVEKVQPHPFTALGWHVPSIRDAVQGLDRKSTRLNSSHGYISYAVFCLKKKKKKKNRIQRPALYRNETE